MLQQIERLLKCKKSGPVFYNAVVHCREQLLGEQHEFILQNGWELTYPIISVMAVYSSPDA